MLKIIILSRKSLIPIWLTWLTGFVYIWALALKNFDLLQSFVSRVVFSCMLYGGIGIQLCIMV